MSNETTANDILCLVQHPVGLRLCRELEPLGLNFLPFKNLQKLKKAQAKREIKRMLVEFEGENYQELVDWVLEMRAQSPELSLIIILPGSMPLFPPSLDLNGIDLILSLEQDFEQLKERVTKEWDLHVTPKVEGRAKKIVDLILERTKDWPRLGDVVDIEEGITMDHPEKHLKSKRNSDSDVLFLLNGQIQNYFFKGNASFWKPDADLILSGPSQTFLKKTPRLMVHSSGPPIKAAVDREGRYFGRSSYALLPKQEFELECVAAYLNSRMVDFYFNKIFTPVKGDTNSGSYLRSLDLKKCPFPPRFLNPEGAICRDRVLELEMLLQSGAGRKHVRVMELLKQLDQIVFDQFEFDSIDLHHFEKLHF